MGRFHGKRFPGESDEYRAARDELLAAEIDLRARIEALAALRRQLPQGGMLKRDYVFTEGNIDSSGNETIRQTKFSQLFEAGKNELILYSFMYAASADKPCPMCTALLDGLNGNAPHVADRVNFAVVAKAPILKILQWAQERGWKNLRFLSSEKNSYNSDYFAENSKSRQLPAINVFRKRGDDIYHFYNTELLYAPSAEGQDTRHVDLIWPLWNLFDLTPTGRGADWYPKFSY